MTRTDLTAENMSHYIAKWGEGERAGLERRIASTSTRALQADYEFRHGLKQTGRTTTRKIARGCLDHGAS